MAGSNLNYADGLQVSAKIGRLLLFKTQTFIIKQSGKLAVKAGAPASNTANDQPNQVSDLCLDTTNNAVYISTLNTNSTTHTWVKISP